MDELDEFLEEQDPDLYEEDYKELYKEYVRPKDFDPHDECFWRDGVYLYSGSYKDAYHVKVYKFKDYFDVMNIDDIDKSGEEKIYRIEVEINGKRYGFIRVLTMLQNNKILKKTRKHHSLQNFVNTLFSTLPVPPYSIMSNTNKKIYFTELGFDKFKYSIDTCISLFKQLKIKDLKIEQIEKTVPKKDIEYLDKYQCLY